MTISVLPQLAPISGATQQNKQTNKIGDSKIFSETLDFVSTAVRENAGLINLRQMVTYRRLLRQPEIAVTEQTTCTAEHAH